MNSERLELWNIFANSKIELETESVNCNCKTIPIKVFINLRSKNIVLHVSDFLF